MVSLSAVVPATNAPPTLEQCVAAIESAVEPPEQVIVAREGGTLADVRNRGAARATNDVLVFVDADVVPHADAFARIRAAFDKEPSLAAVFGSYDDDPADRRVVSSFRNLLHHQTHQAGAGPATTFWTGLGAVRRSAFDDVGGFDPRWQFMEDVDLGLRLHRAGHRIRLDPEIQGTHLKSWTLSSMVWTDFAGRGLPWVEVLLHHGERSTTLNLGWRHRLSALASVGLVLGIARGRPAWVVGGAASLVALNGPFYGLLARKRGPAHAIAGVGLHALHHVVGAAAATTGVARHAARRVRRMER